MRYDLKIGEVVFVNSECQTNGMSGVITKITQKHGKTYVTLKIEGVKTVQVYQGDSLNKLNITKEIVDSENTINIVGVNFIQGSNTYKQYSFISYQKDIKIGDIVVCDTRFGLNLAKVIDLQIQPIGEPTKYTKEIVSIVDTSEFDSRAKNRQRKSEIKIEMDERVKKLQNIAIYKLLSESDETLKELLKEYEEL